MEMLLSLIAAAVTVLAVAAVPTLTILFVFYESRRFLLRRKH